MTKMTYIWLLSVVAFSTAASIDNTNILNKLSTFDEINDEYIDILNSAQDSWTAGHNFPSGTKFADLNFLMGVIPQEAPTTKDVQIPNDVEIPKSFDARKQWPKCQSIGHIRNQGHCGSCWAVSTASTASDRACISSKGKFNGYLSVQHLLSCSDNTGCYGGMMLDAWNYFVKSGLPTGGDYHSNQGCQPYLIKPCLISTGSDGRPKKCPNTSYVQTPNCNHTCYNSKYHKSLKHDLHYGKSAYHVAKHVKVIQREILTHGPVAATFTIYCDILTYKKGVYEHKTDKICGFHAIKIIGWGVENGKDYWLVANEWGVEWGDHGLFKIRRGTDESKIEDDVTAGLIVT